MKVLKMKLRRIINPTSRKSANTLIVVIASTKVVVDFHIPLKLAKIILKRGNVTENNAQKDILKFVNGGKGNVAAKEMTVIISMILLLVMMDN